MSGFGKVIIVVIAYKKIDFHIELQNVFLTIHQWLKGNKNL